MKMTDHWLSQAESNLREGKPLTSNDMAALALRNLRAWDARVPLFTDEEVAEGLRQQHADNMRPFNILIGGCIIALAAILAPCVLHWMGVRMQ